MLQAEQTLAHFCEHGWMRVPGAFDEDADAAMREAVWHALIPHGVHRDDPATWTVERPAKLQRFPFEWRHHHRRMGLGGNLGSGAAFCRFG